MRWFALGLILGPMAWALALCLGLTVLDFWDRLIWRVYCWRSDRRLRRVIKIL